jgi:O-antigen ligase
MLTLLLTLNLKTWALGLHIMSDHQLFFLLSSFLMFYMGFNSLSLFMSMSNLIWININIIDMKRNMLIYVFI